MYHLTNICFIEKEFTKVSYMYIREFPFKGRFLYYETSVQKCFELFSLVLKYFFLNLLLSRQMPDFAKIVVSTTFILFVRTICWYSGCKTNFVTCPLVLDF